MQPIVQACEPTLSSTAHLLTLAALLALYALSNVLAFTLGNAHRDDKPDEGNGTEAESKEAQP